MTYFADWTRYISYIINDKANPVDTDLNYFRLNVKNPFACHIFVYDTLVIRECVMHGVANWSNMYYLH